ncbi:MAG: hypothetical protein HY747_01775 [Elusimicrobia bacterium]|nr:hypothetical protein [Elusimicrobiota bacterium]
MNQQVSITQVSRHFSEYVNRAAYRGEHFILLRGNKALAELKPAPRGRHLKELVELLGSLPHLSAQEAMDFADDLKHSKARLAKRKPRDPWAF